MSKRTILLTIDANEKTCGKCRHDKFGRCTVSGKWLLLYHWKRERLPECLEAEKLAKGVKK